MLLSRLRAIEDRVCPARRPAAHRLQRRVARYALDAANAGRLRGGVARADRELTALSL